MYTGALVEINNTQYLLTEEYTGLLYLSYKLIGAATWERKFSTIDQLLLVKEESQDGNK